MTEEERAIELVESARKKLARASSFVPDFAAEFAESIRGLEELADDLDEEEDDEDSED